ncbi:MAG: recombinase family protein [Candidatus Moranbacteria bacterium]|nr:recombinase family protein [Candidatus Moranbacteria bacterium]
MRYVIYARKSTESEDRQTLSIESQIIEMQEIAKREHLHVVKVFRESKSAKAPGRPVFAEMIEHIGSGKAEGILCWKIDRLARNPVDEGLIKWKLQNEEIRHIRTFDRDYFPNDNVVIASIEFSMANQYIRDLSRNVKRGLNEKVRRGEYPGPRPIGYMTDPKTKKMVPDPEYAPFIVRVFKLYVTEITSTDRIADFLYDEGLRSRAGNKVGGSTIHRILINPTYAGMFEWKGLLHQGIHEPLVPMSLYEEASARLGKKRQNMETKRDFPYRGILVCGECGLRVTAEIQKGHTYYRCTKSKGTCKCSQPYIRAEEVSERIAEHLDELSFDDEIRDVIVGATRDRLCKNDTLALETETRLRKELETTEKKKDSLVEKYINNDIPKDLYDRKYSEYVKEEADITEKLVGLSACGKQLADDIETVVDYLQTLHETFKITPDTSRKMLLSVVSSNVGLKDRNIAYMNLNDPFSWVMEDVAELTAKRSAFEPVKQATGKAKADACATAYPERLGR